jgi:hypothetical protein
MKSTMKLFLLLAIFCGTAFADGDMGNGGRTGDMGNGGLACVDKCVASDESSDVMILVSKYLITIFG